MGFCGNRVLWSWIDVREKNQAEFESVDSRLYFLFAAIEILLKEFVGKFEVVCCQEKCLFRWESSRSMRSGTTSWSRRCWNRGWSVYLTARSTVFWGFHQLLRNSRSEERKMAVRCRRRLNLSRAPSAWIKWSKTSLKIATRNNRPPPPWNAAVTAATASMATATTAPTTSSISSQTRSHQILLTAIPPIASRYRDLPFFLCWWDWFVFFVEFVF